MTSKQEQIRQYLKQTGILTKQSEQLMLRNLEANMNSDFTRDLLKRNWDNSHSTGTLSNLIGEIYLHHILHKDGFEYENYMRRVTDLYFRQATKQMSKEDFDRERARIIAGGIALKLGFDIQNELTQNESNQIKQYFVNEYVTNGYVSHSFPEAYRESIMTNGLVAKTDGRGHNLDMTEKIQKMFMEKGVIAPLGGFPFYSGSGIYYEHDFTKVFFHAIHSPEWFKWFTSSDHLKSSADISTTPYVLRDEEACRRNVMDLCSNAGLNTEESNMVMQFYQENYAKFESPVLNVGLISKKTVDKDTLEIPDDLDLLDTITFVLNDNAHQYIEHKGNVAYETITPEQIKLTHIPDLITYMHAPEYSRETKEHLLDPEENLKRLEQIEDNLARMSPEMIQIVRDTKNHIIESRKNLEKQETVQDENPDIIIEHIDVELLEPELSRNINGPTKTAGPVIR